jgi:hypothetical protein
MSSLSITAGIRYLLGGIAALAAKRRGVSGVVVDGGYETVWKLFNTTCQFLAGMLFQPFERDTLR